MLFKNKKESFVVYTAGAAVLKEIAKPVPVVTAEIRQLASEMIKAMRVFNGIGLAAPQYGHSLRLVVFDVPREGSTGTPGEEYLLPKMPMAGLPVKMKMTTSFTSPPMNILITGKFTWPWACMMALVRSTVPLKIMQMPKTSIKSDASANLSPV